MQEKQYDLSSEQCEVLSEISEQISALTQQRNGIVLVLARSAGIPKAEISMSMFEVRGTKLVQRLQAPPTP